MATQNTTYPWHCTCGSLNGKRAIHCPLCGQHWTVGTPHSNQPKQVSSHSTPSHQWGRRSTTPHRGKGWYQNAQAAEEEQWVKSPRNHAARQRSSSNRAKKGKGKGKGKAKGTQHPLPNPALPDQGVPAGPPAVMPTYQEAPWLMAPPPPLPNNSAHLDSGQAAGSTAISAAENKLKSMYALLEKHPEGLHPDIQKEMKEAKLKEGEVAIKSLHKQVNALGKARTELQNANAARLSLHSSWRTFLVEQVSKWQAYSQQFQQQEDSLSARVNAARLALDTARTNLAVSKSQLQKSEHAESSDMTVTVSDEEEESKESKDAVNSSAQKITDSLQHLGESLKTLSANADELMLAEQQASKRQRTEPPMPMSGSNVPGDGDSSFR